MGDIFKELIFDKLVKASLQGLFTKIPLLGWGPFGIIITFFAEKYATIFYNNMKDVIDLKKIVITNEAFEDAYHRAGLKLMICSENHGQDSPEYKRIKREAKDALADLVQFDIAA